APGTPSCSTRSMRTKASACRKQRSSACGPMRSRTDTMSSLLLLAGKAETFDAEEVLDDFDAELTSTPLYARIKCFNCSNVNVLSIFCNILSDLNVGLLAVLQMMQVVRSWLGI